MLSDALLLGKPPRALPGVTPTQGIWGDDDWAESENLGAMFAEAVASAQAVGDEERSAPGGAPSATVVGAMIVEQSDLGATLSGGGSVLMSGSSLPLVSRRSVWLGSNLCQQGSGLRQFIFRPRRTRPAVFAWDRPVTPKGAPEPCEGYPPLADSASTGSKRAKSSNIPPPLVAADAPYGLALPKLSVFGEAGPSRPVPPRTPRDEKLSGGSAGGSASSLARQRQW